MSVVPDRICVVIARTRHKMIQAELQEAVKHGAKLIELRLDYLAKAIDFKRLMDVKTCPWVATVRRPADGGRWPGTEEQRQIIIRQVIANGDFEWIDLETDIADQIKRFGKTKRIISYHNMTETPKNLDEIYDAMLKQDADIYKIATLANTVQDIERILAIQRRAPKPTVAFGMGEIGFPTRFLALKHGAPIIYAAFNRERGIAPGLPSLTDFKTTYPIKKLGAETKVFGLIGDPVAQSYSPILHNHMMRKLKIDAIYLPFLVPIGELPTVLKINEVVPVQGYSVTIPHKEAAVRVAHQRDNSVTLTGAANTLVRRNDGKFEAFNTDYSAIQDSLQAYMKERTAKDPNTPTLNNMFALVVGAGGVARAVAHALHREGVAISIASRTKARAETLAKEVGCKLIDWEGRHNVLPCDIIVNCTPVGMHPKVGDSPIHHSFLKPGMIVFDTVYSPENTKLVAEARSRGCHVITGVDMFVRQAAKQLELFTGEVPDIDTMRELMRKAMSPLTKAFDADNEEES